MNGIPLMETGDAKLVARGFLLGQKIAANVATSLNREELEYWEKHLPEIPDALRRGFGLTEPEAPKVEAPRFAFADTNAAQAIKEAEDFAEQYFGHRPDLLKQFMMPETLPWKKEVIAVYDPGTLTNREAVEKALKSQKSIANIWEETDVTRYSGSEATGRPTLRFIERSARPTEDTMGLSADEMVATKRTFLDLRGYVIAFATYFKATKGFLDSETWTRFPNNRLPDGKVAHGYWHPGSSEVRFSWYYSDNRDSCIGAREAVECSLVS
ncbi:MAG: hypothetical protein AAB447_02475 [Patescibacteria group bacterium]